MVSQTWSWDYLANQTASTDDQSSFYERSLGAITNGDDESSVTRPSALYLASNLDGGTGNGAGWVEVDYGDGGNMTAMTVHAQCTGSMCADPGPSTALATRREALRADCTCAAEQHYEYLWDELNRLSEARRYDRALPGDWQLEVQQRYRYDAANQRTIKQTVDQDGCLATPASGSVPPCERTALYVYPGDFERRGLQRDSGSYEAEEVFLGTETQYVVAGARMVFRSLGGESGDYDRDERMVVPLGDLIGTTAAAFDVRTGRVVEASTYYPNGARETLLADSAAAAEPSGFTGKEGDEEVGVVYFGERYLVPRLGRWASPDPLHVHQVGGGEALNSFHYVSGNLLAGRDPLGLVPDDNLSGQHEARTTPQTDGRQMSDWLPLSAAPDLEAIYGGSGTQHPGATPRPADRALGSAAWGFGMDSFWYRLPGDHSWTRYDPREWDRGGSTASDPVGNFVIESVGLGAATVIRLGGRIVAEVAAAGFEAVSEALFADIADAAMQGLVEGAAEAVDEMVLEASGAVSTQASLGLRFSQTTASSAFSAEGTFAGETIGSLAERLRSGALSTADVPVSYVNIGGHNLIVNTRSSLALMRAGVPQGEWALVESTATDAAAIEARLVRNGLGQEGTGAVRITGLGRNASSLR